MANRKDSNGKKLNEGEYERKDKRYYYVYTNIKGKKCYVYAKTLAELRKKEEQIEKDKFDGIDTSAGKITLNRLFEMNMELKNEIKATTKTNYMNMWRSNVETATIGNKKISELKQLHIKAFYNDCSKNGLKRNTIKLLHNLIFSSLELAVDSDMIRKNPAKDCMKNLKADAEEKKPLTEEEVQKLINFCNNSCYNVHTPFITIAIGTCMRCGELTGLRWCDVDMKNRTIKVNHQLVYKNLGNGCTFHISTPKTEAGTRTIPMTESVYRAFLDVKKHNLLLGRRCNVIIDGYSDFVFLSGNGYPLATNAVNSFLLNIEKAYNKANKESIPHLSAHILRHTGCTLLASKGMDVKALQDIMGHSDAQITMNVYNHCSTERTEREMQRIEKVVNF